MWLGIRFETMGYIARDSSLPNLPISLANFDDEWRIRPPKYEDAKKTCSGDQIRPIMAMGARRAKAGNLPDDVETPYRAICAMAMIPPAFMSGVFATYLSAPFCMQLGTKIQNLET